MKLQTIIFISRSGGGKGTQINKLIEYINEKDDRDIFHMESGPKFRDFIKGTNYASKLARKVNDTGELQPSFLSVWAWTSLFIDQIDENKHVIIDGTPRRLSEARVLDEALQFFKRENPIIVYLNVSKEWSLERIKERHSNDSSKKREDDSHEDSVAKRLEWFDTDVMPVLDFYKTHQDYRFVEINGERSVEDVYQDILDNIGI